MRQRKIDDTELLEMLKQGKMQKEIAEHFGVSPVAICKRLQRLLPQPVEVLDKYNLTDQQKQFVVEKAKGKTNTQAVMASYEVSSMQSAKVIGSQLMDKPEIKMALDELLQLHLPQHYRIRKLRSHVDNHDPGVSLKALDMSWKLDGSYAPEKHLNVNIDHGELTKEIAEIEEALAEYEAAHPEVKAIDITAQGKEGELRMKGINLVLFFRTHEGLDRKIQSLRFPPTLPPVERD